MKFRFTTSVIKALNTCIKLLITYIPIAHSKFNCYSSKVLEKHSLWVYKIKNVNSKSDNNDNEKKILFIFLNGVLTSNYVKTYFQNVNRCSLR